MLTGIFSICGTKSQLSENGRSVALPLLLFMQRKVQAFAPVATVTAPRP
jgi:hypothetical protein